MTLPGFWSVNDPRRLAQDLARSNVGRRSPLVPQSRKLLRQCWILCQCRNDALKTASFLKRNYVLFSLFLSGSVPEAGDWSQYALARMTCLSAVPPFQSNAFFSVVSNPFLHVNFLDTHFTRLLDLGSTTCQIERAKSHFAHLQ